MRLPRMKDVDRFLELARLSPGAVAVHGGSEGLGSVAILLAALLVRQHSFDAAAAVAWLRIVHPEAHAAPAPAGGAAGWLRRILVKPAEVAATKGWRSAWQSSPALPVPDPCRSTGTGEPVAVGSFWPAAVQRTLSAMPH